METHAVVVATPMTSHPYKGGRGRLQLLLALESLMRVATTGVGSRAVYRIT